MTADPKCINKNTGMSEEMYLVHPASHVTPIFATLNPEEIFIHFYYEYYRQLKVELIKYKSRFTVHTGETDDIVQNTFKKLWEKREQLHLILSPKDYIFTIAKNLLLD